MSIKYANLAALLLRVGFGLSMMLGHGLGKFQSLISGAEIHFPSILGLPPVIALSLAVLGEFVACIFIVIGLKTRLATIPAIATMAVAAFVVHSSDPWFASAAEGGSKEMATLYLLGFVAIYMLDSGKYSIDHKLSRVI
jgi:putative oxidoreductase